MCGKTLSMKITKVQMSAGKLICYFPEDAQAAAFGKDDCPFHSEGEVNGLGKSPDKKAKSDPKAFFYCGLNRIHSLPLRGCLDLPGPISHCPWAVTLCSEAF
jgi:hypothetical protein